MKDDDDIQLQSYQDDLDADDNATDPLMNEEDDDPTEDLGVSAEEFGNELDKEPDDVGADLLGDDADIRDDQREYIEDVDEEYYNE